MLKKLLKVVMTFTLLLGCYFGYVRAFHLVVRQFQSARLDDSTLFPVHNARSKQEAQDLALLTFGPGHWTGNNDRPFAYYNSQKRMWMYWQEYEEVKEEDGVKYDGKRVRMRPFAMIGRSDDGKDIWVMTANTATLDLNQPIGLSGKQSSEGIKVEHALVEGDVRIRDDRGTPGNPDDDMKVGPMTYVDYDDAKRTITTESHVHIEDPDQATDGDGLEILLRKADPATATAKSSSASGFGGAEYAILQKNVRVVMRDVGRSGVFNGPSKPAPSRPAGPSRAVDVTVQAAAKEGGSSPPAEPTPLLVQSEGPMRIDFPPDEVPVAVGPPAPPAPTLVRFERKVVALHGALDREPSQLDCDTLRLTLVPPTPEPAPDKGRRRNRPGPGARKAEPDRPTAPSEALASASPKDPDGERKAGTGPGKVAGAGPAPAPDAAAGEPANKGGLFGNLTLQKAHATGHAVWLQDRKQSAKVRCSELIHERGMPYHPDSTFFRGDPTRPVILEKVDYEQEEAVADASRTSSDRPPAPSRKIKSVTHVRTVSAKLFDRGNGLELADIRAFGPGRLESRPDPGQPVERIAVWQDELTIVNLLKADGTLQQKRVTLTGTRPFFVDLSKKTSLDARQEIRVFLKPRSAPVAEATPVASTPTGWTSTHDVARPPAGTSTAGGGPDRGAETGIGSSLQIERILAYRDVHFKAPNRYMEARSWLDAPFVEVDPPPPAESTGADRPEPAPAAAASTAAAPVQAPPAADGPKPPPSNPVASAASEPPPQPEPTMSAVADRIWAKVAIPRGQSLDPGKDRRRTSTGAPAAGPSLAETEGPEAGPTATTPPATRKEGGEAEVREAWLRGNVAVHQDKPPDPDRKDRAKPQGDDISGEAVYLDNKGPGKIVAKVFHRDPTDPAPLLGPIRWAKVSSDDLLVFGEVLWMDQEHDKVWAKGPGSLSQWTDRAMMTDKAPGPQQPPAAPGGGAAAMAARPPAPQQKPSAPPRPKTRAGVPVAEKDLLTITWTERMEFTGRTKDTAGNPAARADFFGIIDAQMTDARLHCDRKMIAFTDREVPLGDLGTIQGRRAGGVAAGESPDLPPGDENADRAAPAKSRVDIAMIYCYGKPTAINRKVDPDFRIVNELERIDAFDYDRTTEPERLDYNRRTGEFYVPGPGTVYLYDRKEEPRGTRGRQGDPTLAGAAPRSGTGAAGSRTVTPTSARTSGRGATAPATSGRGAVAPAPAAAPNAPAVRRTLQPLVLMQVKFTSGMRGRVGAGQADDTRQERWSEFFGNIEFLRSEVENEGVVLNPDARLSPDGFFLTSQMLRIIQEPPPPGSPEKTPARSYAKAWDRVHVNRGEAFTVESDVATFDSGNDVLWAYGEGGHGVSLAQQAGNGQPPSTSHARAVQYNVKTHAWREVEGSNVVFVDHRTGSRPGVEKAPDPTAPPPPRPRSPYKVPQTNMERRGFTGF